MNELEQKALLLQRTPQVMWFSARYKTMGMYITDLIERGRITRIATSEQLGLPRRYRGMVFEFESVMYFWVFEVDDSGKVPVIEWCHLESLVDKWDRILSSHIVLSSDDDPHEQTYFALLFVIAQKQTNTAFKEWVRSKYINVSEL